MLVLELSSKTKAKINDDRDWCKHALAMGYDSLQVRRFDYPTFVLVFCSGNYASTEVNSCCPPLPLRSGKNASLPCTCDSSQGLINCGREFSPRDNCMLAPPPKNRPKSCTLQRDHRPSRFFNFSVAFKTSVLEFAENISRWASTVKRIRTEGSLVYFMWGALPPKSVVLLDGAKFGTN